MTQIVYTVGNSKKERRQKMYIQIKDPLELKTEIYKQGFSVKGFATRIGIGRTGIHRILKTGRTSPKNAKKISDVLGIDYDQFFLIVSCPRVHDK